MKGEFHEMKEKISYTEALIEVVSLEISDIVTSSSDSGGSWGGSGGNIDPDGWV